MANEYPVLVTLAGRALEVQAKASNTPLNLSAMAVGDAGDNGSDWHPTGAETVLVRERWRGNLNSLMQHPDNPAWLLAEAVLPDNAGGWWIREAGLFTDTGTLYAIAKYPPTFKPVLSDGVAKMLYVRMIFEVTNAASVTLRVDPSIVLATRAYVADRHDTLLSAQMALATAQIDTEHRQLVHEHQRVTRNDAVDSALAAAAQSATWSAIAGKPATFPPAPHAHGTVAHKGTTLEIGGWWIGGNAYGHTDAPAGYVTTGMRVAGSQLYLRCKQLEVSG